MLSSKCLSAQGCHDASFDKKWRILRCDEGRGLHLEFMQTEDVYSAAQVLMEPDASLLMFKEADLYLLRALSFACTQLPLVQLWMWSSLGGSPLSGQFPSPFGLSEVMGMDHYLGEQYGLSIPFWSDKLVWVCLPLCTTCLIGLALMKLCGGFFFLVAKLFIYFFYTEESPPFYFVEVGGRLRINFFLTLVCLLISNVCQLAYR